ncbi:MAG: septal ring lytic transglycosylase RlpA family protein [Bacteroidetes bacterium]|nr:septal ring lytic transglycosylase RlpA family protein [Bacteroidota bacterium]
MKSFAKILFLNLLFTTSLMAQEEEFGLASYYSDLFHGKPTASGEAYDKNGFTCAHKTLPFGTTVKVTRLDNNKSVQVKVTDRGPFISGRVVELSKAAANQIGLLADGSARVKVVVVKKEDKPTEAVTETAKPEEKPKPAETEVAPVKKEEPKKEVAAKTKDEPAAKPTTTEKSVAGNKKTAAKETATAKNVKNASESALLKGSDYQPFDLFEIELKRPEKKGYGVQVAVLSSQDALFKKVADLQEDWFSSILVSVQKGPKDEVLYKVILGSFETQKEADSYKSSLKKKKKMDGFVVDLATLDTDK